MGRAMPPRLIACAMPSWIVGVAIWCAISSEDVGEVFEERAGVRSPCEQNTRAVRPIAHTGMMKMGNKNGK